jgi:hypothetical protein
MRFRLRRNADPQLRRAERAYRSTGDLDAGVAWLQGRLRAGTLHQASLTQLSILGEPAARAILPQPESDGWLFPLIEDWFEFLGLETSFSSVGMGVVMVPTPRPGIPTEGVWRQNYLAPSGVEICTRLALAAARGACSRYWRHLRPNAAHPLSVKSYREDLAAYVNSGSTWTGSHDRLAATESWTPWSIFAALDEYNASGRVDRQLLGTELSLGSQATAAVAEEGNGRPQWRAAELAGLSAVSTALVVSEWEDDNDPDTAAIMAIRAGDAISEAMEAGHVNHPVDVSWSLVAKDIQREVIPWLLR